MAIHAIGTQSAASPLEPMRIERRAPGARDVQIDIDWCGVCHSDLHVARSEWGPSRYPCVPGHEIIGRVSAVGAGVDRFRVGDIVGVGCMVGSCRTCSACADGLEQYCERGMQATYDAPCGDPPGHTLGGYSSRIVVDAHFVLRIGHRAEQLAGVAPLLCAGITTWSPLRHWNVGPGSTVGVVGIGGLGHIGIRLAAALGARVVAFTSSPGKEGTARDLGAEAVVVSSDRTAMRAWQGRLDLILDTVAASHALDPYLRVLRRDGTLVLLGLPETPHPSPDVSRLIGGRRAIAGSLIGGIAETQELLDFCAARGIVCDVETVSAGQVNEAFERMLARDVRYRFVIDMATL